MGLISRGFPTILNLIKLPFQPLYSGSSLDSESAFYIGWISHLIVWDVSWAASTKCLSGTSYLS